MKNVLILLVLLLGIEAYSQESKTIYYDSNWKVISDSKKASFYRKIGSSPNEKGHYLVKDYYITGEIQMDAVMSSYDPEIMDGDVNYYFKNGKKQTERKYINGKENGYYKEWYENGKIENEGLMKEDKLEGEWKYYYANGNTRMIGSYINGLKNGVWKISNIEGEYYLQQKYKDDILISIELIDKSKGLYEYFTEIDSIGNYNITPYISYKTSEEYKLVEPLIRNNINYLKTCTDFNVLQIDYAYTFLWLTNCPYLGKFAIGATKFMADYTTKIEKSYKYSPLMMKMYLLGLGKYFLDNNGKINDMNKFHEIGATFMITYYLELKKIDKKENSKKLEELVDIFNKGKLNDFIKKY